MSRSTPDWDSLCGDDGMLFYTCPRNHTWRHRPGTRGHNFCTECNLGYYSGALLVGKTPLKYDYPPRSYIAEPPPEPTRWEDAVAGEAGAKPRTPV